MVFKDKTNGKLSYILYNNYIKIDGNGGGTMKIISKFIFFIIYDFLNDINGGRYEN